jgi:hypothetical protein
LDKRAGAIQARGLDPGDPAAVRLAEDALEDREAYVRAAAALEAIAKRGGPTQLVDIVPAKSDQILGAIQLRQRFFG